MSSGYRVEITYKASGPFVPQETEVFTFSTESAAIEFARRAWRKKDVAKATYKGRA